MGESKITDLDAIERAARAADEEGLSPSERSYRNFILERELTPEVVLDLVARARRPRISAEDLAALLCAA